MKPVISVIIPVYNAREYLRECIDSVISQRGFEKAELILVDDGSKDVSSAICQMYAERFPNVRYHRQENAGVSAARNKGLELSCGEYIFFADADDFLFGGTVEKILDTVENNNPDFIFFDYKYEYTDAYVDLSFPFPKNSVLDREFIRKEIAGFMLSDSSFNSVWNKAFRKDIIEKNGIAFQTGLKYGEDKKFVLSFMEKADTAFYLAETGYFYRYVESGAILKERTDYFKDILDDYKFTADKYRAFDIASDEADEKNRNFFAVKVVSSIEMAYRKSGKKVFRKTVSQGAGDKEFCELVRECLNEGRFRDERSRKIASLLLKKQAGLIRAIYKKSDLVGRAYALFSKPAEKERLFPVFDNEEILRYPFRITVFTPAYNRRRTINRVFDSLMLQTYKDFEWLIVDDGSSDNLKELIDEYKEKADFPIRYYYKPNGGKHTAINWSYYLTDSEYLITVDSDDALLPESLERFLAIWDMIPQSERRKYWSVVARCRNARTGEMKGGLYPEGINESADPNAEAAKVEGDKISCPRTEILKQFPFPEPEGTTFITESIVWNRINQKYMQYYTNEVLHDCYQGEEDSLSTAWYKNHIKEGYVSNYFWMCSQVNEGYGSFKEKLVRTLKLGYYGYVSGKKLGTMRQDIKLPKYKAVCTAEYPFLFIVKLLRYSKYSDK